MTFEQEEERRSQDCVAASFRNRIKLYIDVCPSVCHTFFIMFPHRTIIKFARVISIDRSDVHTKGQRLKVRVIEVKTQFTLFRTMTPVWIHIWQTVKFRVIEVKTQFTLFRTMTPVWIHIWQTVKFQGHMGHKVADFDPNWAFPDYNSSFNTLVAIKWCIKLDIA